MSDNVTDEMVETAARAGWISRVLDPRSGATREWCEVAWDDMGGSEPSDERADEEIYMRAALEAAAPLIAAQALRDAADAWQWGGWSTITEPAKRPEQVPRVLGIADAVTGWIRARADQIEKES